MKVQRLTPTPPPNPRTQGHCSVCWMLPGGRQCSVSSLVALSSSGPVFAAGLCLWAQCVCPGDWGCVTPRRPQFDMAKWGKPHIGFRKKALGRFELLSAVKVMGKMAIACARIRPKEAGREIWIGTPLPLGDNTVVILNLNPVEPGKPPGQPNVTSEY